MPIGHHRPRAFAVLLVASVILSACGRSRPPVIDRDAVFARYHWWDNRDWNWYEANIPFFEAPDTLIEATYYYRWEVVTKHLTYGSPETGYVFTEFLDRPFWSGTYGAISCPLGHQFYEARWLRDRRVVEDYARYWFETPGAEPRRYSNWYGDAMWAVYAVTHDEEFLRAVYPHMERQYRGWVEERYDPEHRMFEWVGAWDGMETNINSRQTDDAFSGAEGYRPTLNSYLYADALAIGRTAALFGDSATAADYRRQAEQLRRRVHEELWDPEREFFFHQFANDERDGIEAKSLTYETGPFAGSLRGREELGYVPWQFGVPEPGYEAAWQFLMDPEYFFAPYGPTTVERNDPLFYVSPRCCVWSGNSWPYATTQTLAALANLLSDYEQDVVTPADYVELLRVYAATQRRAGRPYIAEAANPDNGSWEGHNSRYHSEHYFHSAFVDLVIAGLVGLRPRADDTLDVHPLFPETWDYLALDDVSYHGHDLAIVWDRTGDRYGVGKGLMLFVDGRKLASADSVRPLTAELPRPMKDIERPDRRHNFAVNNDGTPFPSVSASFSAPQTPPFYVIDGNYWYHTSPANRWTTVGSPNASDSIEVDFGVPRPVDEVKLYFLDDGEGVTAPAAYVLEAWADGEWREIPNQQRRPVQPEGHRANVVAFPVIDVSRIRMTLAHRPGSASGVTELEAWGAAELPLPQPTAASRNFARGAAVSASFTSEFDDVTQVNDGRIAFTRYSRNRWTAHGSPTRRDWIELVLSAVLEVGRIDIYLWGDERGVTAPRSFSAEYWDGDTWQAAAERERLPTEPATWARNTVWIEPVETARLRVWFEHDSPGFSGVTEIEVRAR
jgi:hypothetical protein